MPHPKFRGSLRTNVENVIHVAMNAVVMGIVSLEDCNDPLAGVMYQSCLIFLICAAIFTIGIAGGVWVDARRGWDSSVDTSRDITVYGSKAVASFTFLFWQLHLWWTYPHDTLFYSVAFYSYPFNCSPGENNLEVLNVVFKIQLFYGFAAFLIIPVTCCGVYIYESHKR